MHRLIYNGKLHFQPKMLCICVQKSKISCQKWQFTQVHIFLMNCNSKQFFFQFWGKIHWFTMTPRHCKVTLCKQLYVLVVSWKRNVHMTPQNKTHNNLPYKPNATHYLFMVATHCGKEHLAARWYSKGSVGKGHYRSWLSQRLPGPAHSIFYQERAPSPPDSPASAWGQKKYGCICQRSQLMKCLEGSRFEERIGN